MCKRQANMIDGGIVQIADVFAAMDDAKFNKTKHMEIDGDRYNAESQRYVLFKKKGTTCVHCGLKARYFRKERFLNDAGYHLNLYGIDHIGDEVLLTKDHILARANGGSNKFDNYQTMCSPCNSHKADR